MTELETIRKNNVVGLNTNSFNNAVELFLSNQKANSEKTYKSYKSTINEFIMFATNKAVAQVQWEEMEQLKYSDMLIYRNYLKDRGNSNRTINQKMACLKSLYDHLNKENEKIKPAILSIEKLPEEMEIAENSYGSLTEQEVYALYDFCEQERFKPLVKRMFFETAIITAIRKEAILNLTWSDIKQKADQSGVNVWTICIWDKGKYDYTPITDDFYNKLNRLFDPTEPEGKIFNINEKTLVKTLKDFCKANGIDEDRKIVLHSLKKTSMDMVYRATGGDLVKTASHGHHSGIEMPYRNYLGKNVNLLNKPSYSLFGDRIGIEKLEDYSKEELLEAIQASGNFVITNILENIKKKG